MTEPLPPGETQPAAPPGAPQEPAHAGLGDRIHEQRQTWQPALWLRVLVFAAVAVYLVLFIVLNSHHVRVHWVFTTTTVSLIWVILLAGLIGLVLGVMASQVRRFRSRRRHAARDRARAGA